MKLQFLAIGRSNDEYLDKGISDYKNRIANYFPVDWKIIPALKNASLYTEPDLKRKEGELILKAVAQQDFLIALDERGKMISSVELASFIQSRANESTKQLVFVIGGAFGLDATVLKRANFKWSLSPLTFPHQIVRLILSEQVYRACTILRNERYHHS